MMSAKNCDKKKNHCEVCGKAIVGSSYKFNAHLYQHRAVKARFKCSFCSREFFRSDVFGKHMNSHTGIKNKKMYVCDHCERCFSEKRNLIIHLKIHDEHHAFQYKCLACGMTYCEERLLKYHIRKTHYNLQPTESVHVTKELNETWVERVNKSEVCVLMTKVNNNLISIKKYGVIKTETEEKLDVKDVTEKQRFKEYISSVFAHKDKSQYSKATCDYCKKEMLKKSLLSHIRERHLKIRRFKCDSCNCTFKRHYQMVDHVCGKVKRRHNKTDK